MLEIWIHAVEGIAILATASYGVYTMRVRKRQVAASATHTETSAAETVTDAALKLLTPMQNRIGSLEESNTRLRAEVRELREKVEQYIKDEVAYQAELHEKNVEIKVLHAELVEAKAERDGLRGRVDHLEDVCKRAGINGDE